MSATKTPPSAFAMVRRRSSQYIRVPQQAPQEKKSFHETALYQHSRAAILNEPTDQKRKKIRPHGPQVLGWATLAWFIGVITTFATEQLFPFAQDLKKDLHAHSLSLNGMALDIERVFMGTAVVLITINAIWALKNRKKELEAINSLKDKKDQQSQSALWVQASKDLKLVLLTPIIAATAVALNTIKLIAPMLKTGIFHIFGAIGGCLFSLIEAFQLYGHAKNALTHHRHLKALQALKASDEKAQTPAEATSAISTKISAEEILNSLQDPKDEKALKAMTAGFLRMKNAGFEFSKTTLSREEWINKAIITHTHAKRFEITKAVMHGVIGAAMLVAFAGGHVFTLAATALGMALWATVGSLAARLGIALTPERKILNRSLNKKANQTATLFTRNPAHNQKQPTSQELAPQTTVCRGFDPEI
jgi:hypothetical protein